MVNSFKNIPLLERLENWYVYFVPKEKSKMRMQVTNRLRHFLNASYKWTFIFQRSHAGGPVHLKINLVYCVILFLSSSSFLVKKVSNMDLS